MGRLFGESGGGVGEMGEVGGQLRVCRLLGDVGERQWGDGEMECRLLSSFGKQKV